MSKKEYKRHEWKLEKVYCYDEEKWRYQPMYKDKLILFIRGWFLIGESSLKWCKYPHVDDKNYYKLCGYGDIVSFDTPEKAKEFIECYEAHRKKMIDVENELKYNKYIKVK